MASLRGLLSFTVCRVLSLLQPFLVLGTGDQFIRDILVHYSPTVTLIGNSDELLALTDQLLAFDNQISQIFF